MAHFCRTASGRDVCIDRPSPDSIDIADIAHALSNICHWNGHTSRFFSVAEHSCLVALEVARRGGDALYGLLHDATEAYLGDVIRPLKRLLPEYRDIEGRFYTEAIAPAFGLPTEWTAPADGQSGGIDILVAADNAVLHAEAIVLMGVSREEAASWFPHSPPVDLKKIVGYEPLVARRHFLTMFDAIALDRARVTPSRH